MFLRKNKILYIFLSIVTYVALMMTKNGGENKTWFFAHVKMVYIKQDSFEKLYHCSSQTRCLVNQGKNINLMQY